MAFVSDRLVSTLSFFGRVTDDVSREPVSTREFRVFLKAPPQEALYKTDGYFVFLDLKPSGSDYTFRVASSLYQARTMEKSLPSAAPVELSFDGEDEVYLVVKSFNAALNQIKFDPIPFLPLVPKGAPVLGEAGFSTAIASDLGGVNVQSASLTSVSGLAAGSLLRIVRSHSLIAKRGPYSILPAGMTVAAVKIVEDTPGEKPLDGARARLQKVNALTPVTTVVGGVPLKHVSLLASSTQHLILGLEKDLNTFTDSRGNGLFYFPGYWELSSLEVEFSHPGYLTSTSVLSLSAGWRTSVTIKLTPN